MQRLGHKRREGLILHLLDLPAEDDGRIRSPFFTSGISDEFRGELDPRHLSFEAILERATDVSVAILWGKPGLRADSPRHLSKPQGDTVRTAIARAEALLGRC